MSAGVSQPATHKALFAQQGGKNIEVASERLSALQTMSKSPVKSKQDATADIAVVASKTSSLLETPAQSSPALKSADSFTSARVPVTGNCDCSYDHASSGSHCGG